MYAIIVTGGKQYKVSEGDEIKVEKLDVEPGKEVTFDNVLEVHDKLLKEWAYYFNYTDVWFKGYKLLCESIGDCYFMFNTDEPEQSFIGMELSELVKGSNDPIILKLDKEFKAWSKKKEIHKDFNEDEETKFVPSFRRMD